MVNYFEILLLCSKFIYDGQPVHDSIPNHSILPFLRQYYTAYFKLEGRYTFVVLAAINCRAVTEMQENNG
jgi:hypothetical protein